jgi:hypothetical protein
VKQKLLAFAILVSGDWFKNLEYNDALDTYTALMDIIDLMSYRWHGLDGQ